MRIRTVKPEFWRSKDTAALSFCTRLLFIGLWNYVDDNGVGEDDLGLIRSDLFPREDVEEASTMIRRALDELSNSALITRFSDSRNGRSYFHVTNWHHQKIDRPTSSSKPLPTSEFAVLDESSTNPRREVDEDSSLYQGSEGAREQVPRERGSDVAAKAAPDNTRGKRLPDNWHPELAPEETQQQFPTIHLPSELDKFRDYWAGVPGAKGRKADWEATWRNWLRRATEQSPRHPAQSVNGHDAKVADFLAYANQPRQQELER